MVTGAVGHVSWTHQVLLSEWYKPPVFVPMLSHCSVFTIGKRLQTPDVRDVQLIRPLYAALAAISFFSLHVQSVSAANGICCFNACCVVCQNVRTFLVVVYTVFARSDAALD